MPHMYSTKYEQRRAVTEELPWYGQQKKKTTKKKLLGVGRVWGGGGVESLTLLLLNRICPI